MGYKPRMHTDQHRSVTDSRPNRPMERNGERSVFTTSRSLLYSCIFCSESRQDFRRFSGEMDVSVAIHKSHPVKLGLRANLSRSNLRRRKSWRLSLHVIAMLGLIDWTCPRILVSLWCSQRGHDTIDEIERNRMRWSANSRCQSQWGWHRGTAVSAYQGADRQKTTPSPGRLH